MNRPRGPVKLEDCQLTGPGSGAELFVTEGDSAALAVSRVRDPRFQAVLPMQGKPLNTLKAGAGKVAANPFFSALTGALGTGWGGAFDAGGGATIGCCCSPIRTPTGFTAARCC